MRKHKELSRLSTRLLKRVHTRLLTGSLSLLIILICAICLTACKSDTTSDPFAYVDKIFDDSYVHEINISMSEEDYQNLLNRAIERNKYIGTVEIDGVSFNDVQLSTKGASTLTGPAVSPNTNSYSLKLKFSHDDNDGSCYGLDTLHLNNNSTDASKLRDHITYEMFAILDVPSPLNSYAHVTVNGEEWGLYLALEGMDRSFMSRNALDDAEMYKPECNWYTEYVEQLAADIQEALDNGTLAEYLEKRASGSLIQSMADFMTKYRKEHGLSETDSLYLGSDLKYTGKDPDNYAEIFDSSIKKCSDKDKEKVIKALKKLSKLEVDEAIDTTEIISYFAANNFVVNVDSIANKHNYYLAEDDGLLKLFPWDYNLAMPEAYLSEEAGQTNYGYSIDNVMEAMGYGDCPIWVWILSDDKWLDEYHETIDRLLTDYLESGICEDEIDRVNEMIRPYIEQDTSNLCTLEEYDAAVATLKAFVNQRSVDVRKELEEL